MLDSFISIRCRLALYSFGVLVIFFCIVFLVNQKVYAEDVPWTSVSNVGERVLFQEQSLYSNDRRGEDLVSPSFEGRKHGGEDWGYLQKQLLQVPRFSRCHHVKLTQMEFAYQSF